MKTYILYILVCMIIFSISCSKQIELKVENGTCDLITNNLPINTLSVYKKEYNDFDKIGYIELKNDSIPLTYISLCDKSEKYNYWVELDFDKNVEYLLMVDYFDTNDKILIKIDDNDILHSVKE